MEQGCLALRADDGRVYSFSGGDWSALSTGNRVRIVGRAIEGASSHCMQGTPLVIDRVDAA